MRETIQDGAMVLAIVATFVAIGCGFVLNVASMSWPREELVSRIGIGSVCLMVASMIVGLLR